MVKADMEARLKAVLLSEEGIRKDCDIASGYGISVRSLRRWKALYRNSGAGGLQSGKTGPRNTTNGGSRKYMAGRPRPAYITIQSILTGKGNYSRSGHKFMQQKRTKTLALYI